MKHHERIFSRIARLLLFSFAALLLASATSASAQENKPITKKNLLRAIKAGQEQKKSASVFVEMIKQQGVDFALTSEDEREIRHAGSYHGAKGVNDLIAAVRDNYRNERLLVSLFEYARCEEHFKTFAAVIHSKIMTLPSRFTAKGVRYSYIKRLNLVEGGKPFKSQEEADQYWKETRSLQLLQGMCSTQGKDLYVLSQVFLGDLHGSLVTPVRIEFKFDPGEFSDTKDMHSLLILYSLAQEAQARGLGKDLIIGYLSEALGIAAQIRNPDPQTLQPIKAAIERMLQELGASNLLVLPAQPTQ